MKGLRKFRPKYLFYGVLTTLLFFTQTWKSAGNSSFYSDFYFPLTTYTDTIPVSNTKDSLARLARSSDSLRADSVLNGRMNPNESDTINSINVSDTFSLKISKDSLDAPVNYSAADSAVIMVADKIVILYGKTKTVYKDIELTAPLMELNQSTQILTAISSKDSTGTVDERAHFRQAETSFQSDTIRYNFKTQKGLTKNTFTKQEEMFIQADYFKKVSNEITYASRGVITTCNLDEPHFGFRYNKIKVVNNKVAVTGPIHPEFEEVSIPIYLPFGFFPMKKGRHSGILPPQFTTNEDFGLGLEGLGYYKVLNEYFDVTLRANIYSFGGWSASINPSYRKRYKYNGRLNLNIQSTKFNFKGDPDFSKTKSFFVTWSHSMDNKARPGVSFTGNVNAGTSKYLRLVPYGSSPFAGNISGSGFQPINFTNQLSSSITYARNFKNSNLTVSANHNQNTAIRLINVNLPDIGYTVNTQYPFQRKEILGAPKWYEKLGIAYNGNFRSQVSFYDTAFRFKQLIDTLQWGGQHNFPITLSLPPVFGGALMIAPGIGYEQKWIAQKFRRTWNPVTQKLDTIVTKGFYTDHKISTGFSMNTAIFGTYQFKNSNLIAIRHVIRPSLSINYSPSLSKKHFYETQLDTSGRSFRFSEFDGSLYGFYGEQDFGGVGFSLDNNLEMKVRSKKDTGAGALKKIRLIDGYGFNTGYNFIADSFKLSNFNFYLRSTLFEKLNITANATLNPYQADSRGFQINKYAWQGGKFSLGRFSNGSLSLSTDFRSKPKDEKKEQERKQREEELLNDPNLSSDMMSQLDYMRRNPAEFVDFNIPWTVSFGLSVNFTERFRADYSGFEKVFTSNLNFNGSFSLTPRWNFSMNGFYDLDTRNLQSFQMSISREMHCWQMSINVTPVGLYRSFNITISPKSSILQDLKINRTRFFSNF